jgi:hypothetical protein
MPIDIADLLIFCSFGFTVLFGVPSIASTVSGNKMHASFLGHILMSFEMRAPVFIILAFLYSLMCSIILAGTFVWNEPTLLSSVNVLVTIITIFTSAFVVFLIISAWVDAHIVSIVTGRERLLGR